MFGQQSRSRNEEERISQADVQDAVHRLQGRLSARMTEAFAPFASSEDVELRLRAQRDHLAYQAAVLDIATGPLPESNLLDMVAFIDLATEVCRSRWSVDVHGDRGAALDAVFQAAAADAWDTARMLLTANQENRLRTIIRDWHDENPDILQVAAVRLPTLSAITGATESRAEAAAHGLFSNVRKGVEAADMARLLGERALVAAQRMPFLLRLQATLAVSEAVREVTSELPERVAQVTDVAAQRAEEHVQRVIVTGAIAAAGVVVVAALAYAIVR